jgi:hypothetical protein
LKLEPDCILLCKIKGGMDSESHISDGRAEFSVNKELSLEVEVVDKI